MRRIVSPLFVQHPGVKTSVLVLQGKAAMSVTCTLPDSGYVSIQPINSYIKLPYLSVLRGNDKVQRRTCWATPRTACHQHNASSNEKKHSQEQHIPQLLPHPSTRLLRDFEHTVERMGQVCPSHLQGHHRLSDQIPHQTAALAALVSSGALDRVVFQTMLTTVISWLLSSRDVVRQCVCMRVGYGPG